MRLFLCGGSSVGKTTFLESLGESLMGYPIVDKTNLLQKFFSGREPTSETQLEVIDYVRSISDTPSDPESLEVYDRSILDVCDWNNHAAYCTPIDKEITLQDDDFIFILPHLSLPRHYEGWSSIYQDRASRTEQYSLAMGKSELSPMDIFNWSSSSIARMRATHAGKKNVILLANSSTSFIGYLRGWQELSRILLITNMTQLRNKKYG